MVHLAQQCEKTIMGQNIIHTENIFQHEDVRIKPVLSHIHSNKEGNKYWMEPKRNTETNQCYKQKNQDKYLPHEIS